MKRIFARSLLTATSLSLMLLINGVTVQARQKSRIPPGVSVSPAPVGQSLRTGTREWTREEMLKAIPLDMSRADVAAPQAGTLVPRPTGARGGTTPGAGGAASDGMPRVTSAVEQLERESAGDAASFEILPLASAFTYPYPFTRYAAFTTDYTAYPYRAVGKVFFKQGGVSFSCSASSIGNYGVITAGHCVHKGNNLSSGWSTDFVFIPGYRGDGLTAAQIAPYGQFFYDRLWVMTPWMTSGNSARDVGGAILRKNTVGFSTLKVSQRVGWLGTLWNASYFQHFHSLGYPGAPPFNGRVLQICSSSFGAHDTAKIPNTYGIGCDATQGTSGGPVVVGLRAAAGLTNRVNGVNSYRPITQPLALYSPYFDTSVGSLINCLINSGPGVSKCAGPPAL